MADVVIFGVKDYAELAYFYLSVDSEHDVVAFTVDDSYIPPDGKFLGLPVVPFKDLEERYPPAHFMFFAPMSAGGMNKDRERVYHRAKARGYQCINYISSYATVMGEVAGDNCFILEDNTIQPFTKVGSNVVLWSGNHIGHHGVIGDHVTVTSHVVISGHCTLGQYSFIGVNATLRDNISVAEGTFVAMASAIVKSTEPWSAYRGNPARKLTMSSLEINM